MAVVALKPRRGYSFTDHAVANPGSPAPGDRLDGEVDRIDRTLAQILDFLGTLSPPPPVVKPLSASPTGVLGPQSETHSIAGADPNALAMDWAEVSAEWAEHMPDNIPPNILAVMGVTGDHWSARWWAHRALEIVQELPGGPGGAAVVHIGAVPPALPTPGLLWWDTVSGQLFVFYNDASSSQWVPATNQPVQAAGTTSAAVTVGATPPASAVPGVLWWCVTDGQLYVFYQDANSAQWVPATNASFGPSATNIVAPASGATVILADARPVYVDNPATLSALTLLLPPAAPDTVVEIGFRSPVTLLTLQSAAAAAIPTAPDSAFGPGAAIQMKLLDTTGWVYWK